MTNRGIGLSVLVSLFLQTPCTDMIEAIRHVKIAHGTCYAVAVSVAVATVTLAAVSHVYIHAHQMSN